MNISNEDIVNGNPKLTLGLIWNIISHFQVMIIIIILNNNNNNNNNNLIIIIVIIVILMITMRVMLT